LLDYLYIKGRIKEELHVLTADGASLVLLTVLGQYVQAAKIILDWGADPNVAPSVDDRPLMIVLDVQKDNLNEPLALTLLSSDSIEVEFAGRSAITPLMFACHHLSVPVVQKLLTKGANAWKKSSEDPPRTPLRFAVAAATECALKSEEERSKVDSLLAEIIVSLACSKDDWNTIVEEASSAVRQVCCSGACT
jgi:hypothetical protein